MSRLARGLPARRGARLRKPVEQAEVLAVSALDELVAGLIAANRLGVPQPFLDWVCNEATALVEQHARQWARQQALAGAATDYPAIRRQVHGWVMPRIADRFGEFAESRAQAPAPRPRVARSPLVHAVDITLP